MVDKKGHVKCPNCGYSGTLTFVEEPSTASKESPSNKDSSIVTMNCLRCGTIMRVQWE